MLPGLDKLNIPTRKKTHQNDECVNRTVGYAQTVAVVDDNGFQSERHEKIDSGARDSSDSNKALENSLTIQLQTALETRRILKNSIIKERQKSI